MQNPSKKLLDQVRDVIRLKHYSYRIEETYVKWIVRYILFHNKRHPKDMGDSYTNPFPPTSGMTASPTSVSADL